MQRAPCALAEAELKVHYAPWLRGIRLLGNLKKNAAAELSRTAEFEALDVQLLQSGLLGNPTTTFSGFQSTAFISAQCGTRARGRAVGV